MIPGGSRRKLPRDISRSLQPAFEQLQLPWLCPAVYQAQSPVRPRSQRRATATINTRRLLTPPRTQTSPIATTHTSRHDRGYAYAASTDHTQSLDDYYIPLVSDSPALGQSWGNRPTDLPPFDPANPLILDDSTFIPEQRHRAERLGGISTDDMSEVYQNLEACLAVGLHERAAAMMHRLNKLYPADSPDLLRAHNFYIGHVLGRFIYTRDSGLMQYIQKWYHVDMLGQGIQPDSSTYALMIQLVLRDENEKKAARYVRKYVTAAEEAGFLEAVKAELSSVVPQDEYAQIAEMAPGYFNPATEITDQPAQEREQFEDTLMSETTANAPQIVWEAMLPEVAPVDQKGEGLKALRKSLSVFSDSAQAPDGLRGKEAQDKVNLLRQLRLENDAQTSALERWRAETELAGKRGALHSSLQSRSMGEIMWQWHESLLQLLKEEIGELIDTGKKETKGAGSQYRAHYGPYLRFISPEKISVISIVSTLNQLALGGSDSAIPVARVVLQIGKAIEEESAKEWAKVRRRNRFAAASRRHAEREGRSGSSDIQATSAEPPKGHKHKVMRHGVSSELEPPSWSAVTRARVGAAVFVLLLKAARIPQPADIQVPTVEPTSKPAFIQSVDFSQGRRLGTVRCDKELARKMASSPGVVTLTKHLPMLTKPVPWRGFKEGAYFRGGVNAVRLGLDTFQNKSYLNLATKNGDMKQVFTALDVLGRVPWRVNRNVFEVMLKVWNTGEQFANIAPQNPIVAMPDPPAPDADLKTKIHYAKLKREAQNKLSGYHSDRCFQNFQLEVARAYLNETFYMPHNLDFRGRAYPIPPYLNHMGADHCRGLLLFGDGKELGVRGLEWLKIHLANLYGYDKASLSERRAFTEKHIAEVYESANNPLNGSRWWLKAEDPWQCLATCFELRDALESPDPTKFVSHLPVHQDGTCNGLQHYAALGGDEIGAKQVNLEPGDRPSDIYTAVADHVKASIKADADEGVQLAQLLHGKIVRKVVKQTVMTNVYGVTFQGARLQVVRQLEDLYPETFGNDPTLGFVCATYIARNIFKALAAMFNGASAIQQWLGECASRVCEALTPEQLNLVEELVQARKRKAINGGIQEESKPDPKKKKIDEVLEHTRFKSSVIWTTPLRMPVVQPYRATATQRVKTNLQDISIMKPNAADQVSKRKQLQAFPPNFIHSLDATHMLLSALHCDEQGMTFAAVHDSFWTHAADIDRMNTTLRDAFVQMHGEDIVGRLAAEFDARYKDCMYMASISKKSPLAQKIAALRKQRGMKVKDESMYKIDELLEERKRLTLLASEDPELRAQGEAMVTPGSLYAEMTDEGDLSPPDEASDIVAGSFAGAGVEADNSVDVEASSLTSSVGRSESDFNEEDWTALPDDTMGEIVQSKAEIENRANESQQQPKKMSKKEEKRAYAKALTEKTPESTMSMMQDFRERKTAPPSSRHKHQLKTWVWLPLKFPPVPEKGSWDVTRLKESKYFFS